MGGSCISELKTYCLHLRLSVARETQTREGRALCQQPTEQAGAGTLLAPLCSPPHGLSHYLGLISTDCGGGAGWGGRGGARGAEEGTPPGAGPGGWESKGTEVLGIPLNHLVTCSPGQGANLSPGGTPPETQGWGNTLYSKTGELRLVEGATGGPKMPEF